MHCDREKREISSTWMASPVDFLNVECLRRRAFKENLLWKTRQVCASVYLATCANLTFRLAYLPSCILAQQFSLFISQTIPLFASPNQLYHFRHYFRYNLGWIGSKEVEIERHKSWPCRLYLSPSLVSVLFSCLCWCRLQRCRCCHCCHCCCLHN